VGGGLAATYDVRLRLMGKHAVDFLLLLIELFSCGIKILAQVSFVLSQSTRLTDRQTDRQTERPSNAVSCITYSGTVRMNRVILVNYHMYSIFGNLLRGYSVSVVQTRQRSLQ